MIAAVKHLDCISKFALDNDRTDVFIMVSVTDWSDIEDIPPGIAHPNFWISTNISVDLEHLRLREREGAKSSLTAEWLRSANMLNDHVVLENPSIPAEK